MGILLVIRTPLCPPEAEDCAIDEWGSTTHLSITVAAFALLIALPITALRARVGWGAGVGAFVAAVLANLAWHLSGDNAWVLGLAVAAVALLAAYVLAARGKAWIVAAAFVVAGVGYPVLSEFRSMLPIVTTLHAQGGALVPHVVDAYVTSPGAHSDEVTYTVTSGIDYAEVTLSKGPGTTPCGTLTNCTEEQPGIWRATDATGRAQYWVRGDHDQWAHLRAIGGYDDTYLGYEPQNIQLGDLARSLRPGSPWHLAVHACGICNHLNGQNPRSAP
jgi:hypothetical protein